LEGISKAAVDALRYALGNSHNSVIWAIYEPMNEPIRSSSIASVRRSSCSDGRLSDAPECRCMKKKNAAGAEADGKLRKAEENANGLLVIV
jgi:hypothetical protein